MAEERQSDETKITDPLDRARLALTQNDHRQWQYLPLSFKIAIISVPFVLGFLALSHWLDTRSIEPWATWAMWLCLIVLVIMLISAGIHGIDQTIRALTGRPVIAPGSDTSFLWTTNKRDRQFYVSSAVITIILVLFLISLVVLPDDLRRQMLGTAGTR